MRTKRTLGLVLLLLAVAFAGCMKAPGGEQRQSWANDVPDRDEIGQEASFNVQGSPWALRGTMTVLGTEGGWRLDVEESAGGNGVWTLFPDARIDGGAPVLIAVEGEDIAMQGGSIGSFEANTITSDGIAITVEPGDDLGAGMRSPVTFSGAVAGAEGTYQTGQRVGAPSNDLRVEGFDAAFIVRDGGDTVEEVGDVPAFSAPGWIWGRFSSMDTFQSLDIDAKRFALGGPMEGPIHAEDGIVVDPEAIMGNDAMLHTEPYRVRSEGDFRLTQALSADGLLVDAAVEVDVIEERVVVAPGKEDWVRVNFREASYKGDAVVENIRVSGPGADMVRVPTAPGTFIQDLWDWAVEASQAAPWGAPFFLIPVVIASPFVVMTEIIACIFSDCPEGHPYPVWMEAASVDWFAVHVRPPSDQAPGDYPVTVHVEGQNHDTISFEFTIEVEET